MTDRVEYLADKITFERFIDRALQKGWLRTAAPETKIQSKTYYDTPSLDLYRKEIIETEAFPAVAHDITGKLDPIFTAEEESTCLYMDMAEYEGEQSIIRVELVRASINLLQFKGRTSSETIALETVTGSMMNMDVAKEHLAEIFERVGFDLFESSVAEAGFEFHQKFTPLAKSNPGNYITCDID